MKTVLISASLLLTAFSGPIFSAEAAETPYVAQGARALASGLWSQSAAYSLRALETPGLSAADTLHALTALCISQTKLANFEDAMSTCDKAVKASPAEWTAYINRGNLKAMLGYTSSAKADYARAQALNPTHPVVQAAMESRFSRSMTTAPFVGITAPGTTLAKGPAAAATATAQ